MAVAAHLPASRANFQINQALCWRHFQTLLTFKTSHKEILLIKYPNHLSYETVYVLHVFELFQQWFLTHFNINKIPTVIWWQVDNDQIYVALANLIFNRYMMRSCTCIYAFTFTRLHHTSTSTSMQHPSIII